MVLAPEQPVVDWLIELDAWLLRSPGFFSGRPVVLDVAALGTSKSEALALIDDLAERNIKIIGVEGADPTWFEGLLPTLVRRGNRETEFDVFDLLPEPGGERIEQPKSLVIDQPVRSGQSIAFPEGDVTIMGAVASGAEIIAGGSIHVYGPLRGRAIAGVNGQPARIFCRKLEAELLSIDGLYLIADDMDETLRGRPVQARLDKDSLVLSLLD
jgi:septum site-determining protein MinC